ncbi:tail completion protein gp17 [Lysobacter fragariae]
MYPSNLFALLDVATLRTLLGTPVRIYPFGESPADVAVPYVAHQLVSAVPDNNVDDSPEIDDERIQFNVWGDSVSSVSAVAKALRLVLEQAGIVNNYQSVGRDPETNRYGYLIDWSRLETVR